jgi:two-component system chemotaxis response regulator CheB
VSRVVKVLIVDDSPAIRHLLSQVLDADPQIQILGAAGSGAEALEFLAGATPDVITIDINMPVMDGFTLTRRIMESRPCPVVIVSSSWRPEEVAQTFKAVEAGAVAIMGTPHGPGHPRYEEETRSLVRMVKSMSEVKVVRRWPRGRADAVPPRPRAAAPGSSSGAGQPWSPVRLIAIGASTGGPMVLQTILANLPHGFPAPVLIVQHIVPGFSQGMAEWLTNTTHFPVEIARHGQPVSNHHAYLAPDGVHMGISRDGRVLLAAGPEESGLRPAVGHLFRSVAEAFGPTAAGVLLTGMGRDGAEALLLMKQRGAMTIAQDRETSAIFGMPGEAVRLGAATYVLPPEKIAALLGGAVDWH